jgi:hypothetical protein
MTRLQSTLVFVLAFVPSIALAQVGQSNERLIALTAAAAQIVPRSPTGDPDANGRIVLLTLGMSNTKQVSEGLRYVFRRETNDLHPALTFVNGAQGGMAAAEWANPACQCWTTLSAILDKAAVTDAQVAAIFLMTTVKHPRVDAPTTAAQFAVYTRQILTLIEARFPHVAIVIPAANYYGGYDVGQDKTPEPHQWQQTTTLPDIQETWSGRTVLAAWHPWTDGDRVRDDGLNLELADVTDGGVHLATSGKLKISRTLKAWLWAQPWTYGWLRH